MPRGPNWLERYEGRLAGQGGKRMERVKRRVLDPGIDLGNLLALCQRGQSVTKGLLLRGGVLQDGLSPNTAWVTAVALDTGQTAESLARCLQKFQ